MPGDHWNVGVAVHNDIRSGIPGMACDAPEFLSPYVVPLSDFLRAIGKMAVPQQDSVPPNRQYLLFRKNSTGILRIIISMDRHDRGDAAQFVQNSKIPDVPRVQDQLDAGPEVFQPVREVEKAFLIIGIRKEANGRKRVRFHFKTVYMLKG